MKKILVVLVAILLLPSCMTTRTNVGSFKEMTKVDDSQTYTYDKGKQFYLFWGLLPLGRRNVSTPQSGNCQVRTAYNFWDAFFSCITGGIFEMQTIKVKALKNETALQQPAGE